jgi:hypothetical protein
MNQIFDPLFERIGYAETNWVHAAIHRWRRENDPNGDRFEYSDNTRIAIKGDLGSELVYEDRRDAGCCGSVDVELGPSPTGRTYLFGFNYGH